MKHFPSLDYESIKAITASILAVNSDSNVIITGDLINFKPEAIFDLCKRELDLKASADTNGNKSASAGITITSDDKSSSISVKGEFKESDKGEKEGKVALHLKQEF